VTGVQKAWAKQKPADLARIAKLEAYHAGRGEVLAPRGECSSCDAGRGVMWPDVYVDGKRQPLTSCASCRAFWPKLREVENLVRGWGAFQQAVADAGGWTPDMLREHSRLLDLRKPNA
jgi:hypothetical protein